MKKLLVLLIVLLGSCCGGPYEQKQYDFEIIYANADTVNVTFVGCGDNLFSLKSGDLTTENFTRTLVSGIRSYRLISIKKIGMITPKTREEYELRQVISNEE